MIGAARSGQSWHLMPVFGSILAVIVLGEQFHIYHAVGIALIAGGIVLASVKKGAPAKAKKGKKAAKKAGKKAVKKAGKKATKKVAKKAGKKKKAKKAKR